LSKKTANDGVNKFKLALINNCLRGMNGFIGSPLEGFETFDESLLPSNSDVALILGQYVAAMYAFRLAHTGRSDRDGGWWWMVESEPIFKALEPYHFK